MTTTTKLARALHHAENAKIQARLLNDLRDFEVASRACRAIRAKLAARKGR